MAPDFSLELPWLPASDTHAVVCAICNGTTPAEDVFAFTLNREPFTIRQCIADDLLYLNPQPGSIYAEALYNHPSYFEEANDMYGHIVNDELGAVTAGYRMKEISERTVSPKTFLEIGCGKGYTLDAAKKGGMSVYGIEFSETSVHALRARGLTVEQATLEDPIPAAISEAGPFDVVALYSVLEHVPDPRSLLELLKPLVAVGGTLVIRVPRMSASGPWLSLLDHFWHFTPAAMEKIAAVTGFTITDQFASGSFIASDGRALESMTLFLSPNL